MVFVFMGAPDVALAQQAQLTELGQNTILPQTDLIIIIARIIRAVLGIIGIILVILMIYAGWVYMTSQGDPEKVNKSKNIIKRAVIGFIIVMSSFSIAHFVLTALVNGAFRGGSGFSDEARRFQEPNSGSLGLGIIEDHYPARGAVEIPRNTSLFVTFKVPIEEASLAEAVRLFPTAEGEDAALSVEQLQFHIDESKQQLIIDPTILLGSANAETNYTVFLTPELNRDGGESAFVGRFRGGYQWTFTVSTEVDLTPPKVRSVIPVPDDTYDRNIVIEMTFNEAMNPIAASGVFNPDEGQLFENIQVRTGEEVVHGSFDISNHYRTVSFTPTLACGQDPCGGTIFCLPGGAAIDVTGLAATLGIEPPQAIPVDGRFDGLVDAAANSLDGNADGVAEGPETDSYQWSFTTTENVNTTVPQIESTNPSTEQGEVDLDHAVEITFDTLISGATMRTSNVQLWPDPFYEMFFSIGKSQAEGKTTAIIDHPTFIPPEEGGQFYWPVVNSGVRSAYQICLFPAVGPDCTGDSDHPYCCNRTQSSNRCVTGAGDVLDP